MTSETSEDLEKFATSAGGVMNGTQRSGGVDREFTALLHQLAELHHEVLGELHALRAPTNHGISEKVACGKDCGSSQEVVGAKVSCGAKDEEAPSKGLNSIEELSVLPEQVKDIAPGHVTCDDVEVLQLEYPSPPGLGKESVQIRHPSRAWSVEPFCLRDNWLRRGQVVHADTFNVSAYELQSHRLNPEDWGAGDFSSKTAQLYQGHLRHFILFPASTKRLVWDLIGALLIFWDLVIIPLNLSGLTPKDSVLVEFMDWLTLIFWTLNMFASLVVGYVEDGVTEMNPLKILIHYLKTWFVIDLIVVLPDWIFTSISGSDSDGASDSVKMLRMLRLVRCMRLLRLAKLRTIINSLTDLIDSEYFSIVVNIFKMMVALITINHFIGCMWYLTADSQIPGDTWITVHGFQDSEWVYQYLTSFHWGITQFTPSSMHVQPQNSLERVFAIAVVIFGLIAFSYLVGSITGSLQELRRMNSDTQKLFWMLRRYLRQNKIPRELCVRIQKFLIHKHASLKVVVSREHVSVLKHLSEQLESELQCALNVPHMIVHPLFMHFQAQQSVTMQRLATNAIARKQLACGDSLFSSHETASHMSFVVDGSLQYIKTSLVEHHRVSGEHQRVSKGTEWISEPVLWTEWQHLGELIAECPTDVLLISPKQFGSIIKTYQQVHEFVSAYAASFLAWINGMERETLSDITQGDACMDNVWEPMGGGRFSFLVPQRGVNGFSTRAGNILSGPSSVFAGQANKS